MHELCHGYTYMYLVHRRDKLLHKEMVKYGVIGFSKQWSD